MTSTTGRDSHPEVPEISDLSEGLLPPERSAEVRLHIAGCSLCADVLSSLEEIRGLLGTLPGPPRMPADVAGRIDAALAAEALLDSTRPDVSRGTSPTPSATPSPSASPSSSPRRVPRETSPGPAGHPDRATGPGRSAGPGTRPAGRARRRGLFVAAGIASVLLVGGVAYEIGSGPSPTSGNSDAMKSGVSADGSDSVGTEVRRLLAADPGTTSGPSTMGPKVESSTVPHHGNTPMRTDGGATGADPAGIPSCVLQGTHRSQVPLAAERELYRGRDAYLVVLPSAGDPASVDAFVVSASCTAASPAEILFTGTYPR